MKYARVFVILLNVSLILFFIYRLDQKNSSEKKIASEAARSLVNCDKQTIDKVSFSTADDLNWALERKEDSSYSLTRPFVSAVKVELVDQLIQNICTFRYASKFSPEPGEDYGFDSVRYRLKIQQGNSEVDIEFGSETIDQMQTYYRIVGETEVYIAQKFILLALNRDASDFRNRIIFSSDVASAKSIAYKTANFTIQLNNDQGKWLKVLPKNGLMTDEIEVQDFIMALQALSVDKFTEFSSEVISQIRKSPHKANVLVSYEGFEQFIELIYYEDKLYAYDGKSFNILDPEYKDSILFKTSMSFSKREIFSGEIEGIKSARFNGITHDLSGPGIKGREFIENLTSGLKSLKYDAVYPGDSWLHKILIAQPSEMNWFLVFSGNPETTMSIQVWKSKKVSNTYFLKRSDKDSYFQLNGDQLAFLSKGGKLNKEIHEGHYHKH